MIRGEHVNLRAVDRHDGPSVFRWFNDPDVMRYWGAPESTRSLAWVQHQIEGWIEEEIRLGRPSALVVERLDGDPIGLVVVSSYAPTARSAQLSIMIGETALWGQGLGRDLLQSMLDTCFLSWNLHRVWLRSEATNERAHRLYRRCGFTHEATLRQAAFLDGRFEDVFVFGLLAEEWAGRTAATPDPSAPAP